MGIAHSYPLRRVRARIREVTIIWIVSCHHFQHLWHCIHTSSGGSWYSYPHIGVRHEDNSFVHQVSAYHCPFTICFKTKFMTLFFTGEYHRSRNVQNLKRWNNTLYSPAARVLRTHSCTRAFPPTPAVTLDNLLGPLVMSLSSALKILFGEWGWGNWWFS